MWLWVCGLLLGWLLVGELLDDVRLLLRLARAHAHKLVPGGAPPHWRRVTGPSAPTAVVVLLHGLSAHPVLLEDLRERLPPGVASYAPLVRDLGQCTLAAATADLRRDLLAYLAQQPNPALPVILVGQSNGARISCALELELRRHRPAHPVLVCSVVGPLGGSATVDRPLGLLARCLGVVSEINAEELAHQSPVARQLLACLRQPLPAGAGRRRYRLYAGALDTVVTPRAAALPALPGDTRHTVLPSATHLTAVAHAESLLLRDMVLFLASNTR